jgi:hypothetical protein
MDSRTSRLALLAVTVFLGLGCKGGDETPPPYTNPNITPANYQSIEIGMPVAEVRALLGETFEEHASVPDVRPLELDGEPVDAILSWKDQSGRSTEEVTVWVKDDVVFDKGQRGLIESHDADGAASEDETSAEQE